MHTPPFFKKNKNIIKFLLSLSHSDMNECAVGTDDCNSTLGICTNTLGSYSCFCVSGYTGDGRTCQGLSDYVINKALFHGLYYW